MMIQEWREQGVPAARKPLQGLDYKESEHPLLTLQRYLKRHKPKERSNQDTTPEEDLLEAVRQMQAPRAYTVAFRRWQQFATARLSDRARVYFTLTAPSPIAIGLGNASPLEVGLTLHHIYGMPIIPGSALKGLCRRGALQLVEERKIPQADFEYLFGTGGDKNAAAGAVVFYDAWYVPDSVGGKPFHRDVITVHHPEYYGSRGAKPPTDFDDPNPVPFLVVKPGVQFLLVLEAATPGWAQFTEKLLRWCLANLGVGAKTNAGYGYFRLEQGQNEPNKGGSATTETETILWENAHLRYDRSRRTLSATSEGKNALADEKTTLRLIEQMPEGVRELLRKQSIRADVRVQQEENQRIIVEIVRTH